MKLIKFNKDSTCRYLINKAYRHLISDLDRLVSIVVGIAALSSIFLKIFPLALIGLAVTPLVITASAIGVFLRKLEVKKLKKIDGLVLN